MARLGFIGRIGRAIRNVVAPPSRPPEPPERPREPPAPRGDDYKNIWRDIPNKGRANYRKNLKVFHAAIDPIEQDPAARLELWESYVQNIVAPRGRKRRQDTSNMFWRDSGLDPADFGWQAWREAMGYTGKRRSRTP